MNPSPFKYAPLMQLQCTYKRNHAFIKFICTVILVAFFTTVHAQKGASSITAGTLISFPHREYGYRSSLKTGVGIEANGQYNFSNKSALVIQSGIGSWGVRDAFASHEPDRLTLFSLKGGYRYQFASAFYLNALAGAEVEMADGFSTISFSVGGGKRIKIKEVYFVDLGVDLVEGDREGRINIKAAFSLFQSGRKN